MKDCKSCKTLYTKKFTYTKRFYVHEFAAVNLSKIYFLKNAKKTCKPNNRDLYRDWITYTHGTIVNIYIVYEISKNFNVSSHPALENCLFGAVSLTKNNDIDEYMKIQNNECSGYGIGFDRIGEFSFG